jgi:uncharacterized lipoprotein YbaY
MAYRGHIENGKVVLDDPVALPEGASVQVDLVDEEEGTSLYDRPITTLIFYLHGQFKK